MGGGGGRTRANSVCFTKNVVKIGAFPNATPTSKIWKNLSVDQKDQRHRSVWVGHAKSVLSVFTQEFSLVMWLLVRPENEP